MTTEQTARSARVGDWLEAHGPGGKPLRRGQILEILGRPGHMHYRVRWDEHHESIFYPQDGDGVVIQPRSPRRKGSQKT